MNKQKFLEIWEKNKETFCKLIQIPSIYDEATIAPETPYGKPVREALDYMKLLCDEARLHTEMYNDEVLTASWGSEAVATEDAALTKSAAEECVERNREALYRQNRRLDIVSHLDVVGIEGAWKYDPFSGQIQDGFIYGRGTQDMKSGAFLSLLALKILKEEMEEKGITPKGEIRLVFGSDEERTMEEMKRYVKIAGKPAFAFTPDGQFPMAIGEKGALMWEMSGNIGDTSISMTGGVQPNVIAPFAEAVIKKANFGQMPDASEKENSGKENQENKDSRILEDIHLAESGIAAHASRPEQGDSAIVKMLRTLTQETGNEMLSRLYQFFSDPYGVGAGMGFNIEPMGKLTLNPGIMKIQDGKLFVQIDCRYPYGVTSEELTGIFREAFPELEICLPYDDPPTLVSEEDEYVQLLKEAYQESVGVQCEPYISGGVSYSKVFGHCVAFGCVAKDSVNTAHQKDEKIAEKDMIEALEIYYRAFRKFMNVAEIDG